MPSLKIYGTYISNNRDRRKLLTGAPVTPFGTMKKQMTLLFWNFPPTWKKFCLLPKKDQWPLRLPCFSSWLKASSKLVSTICFFSSFISSQAATLRTPLRDLLALSSMYVPLAALIRCRVDPKTRLQSAMMHSLLGHPFAMVLQIDLNVVSGATFEGHQFRTVTDKGKLIALMEGRIGKTSLGGILSSTMPSTMYPLQWLK